MEKTNKSSTIRRIGIGFEDPSDRDVFADGSACRGPDPDHPGLEKLELYRQLIGNRRRIDPNPPAGEVRRRELEGAWMQKPLREIQQENDKARKIVEEKRIFGLGRQAAAGLALAGAKGGPDATGIANHVRDAYRYRAARAEAQRSGVPPADHLAQKFNPNKLKELEHSNEILDAVLQYKIYKLADLLGCPVKKPKTFGLTEEEVKKAGATLLI